LYGLHEALVMLREEGLEKAWARHWHLHGALRSGLEAMGLSFLVKENKRLPQLNVIHVPPGVDEAILRRRLLDEYNLDIGAGLGALAGKVIRIGLMGHGANMKNVMYCLEALEAVLFDMRAPIQTGVAMNAAQSAAILN
jgi:alanine-glyoxylate transaminase/serine-glyoxylate transaminase/serine-pyruvate transaminase